MLDPEAGVPASGRKPMRPLWRVAVIDSEIELADTLMHHSFPLDWEVRLIERHTSIADLTAMRLNAIVVDIATVEETMRSERWAWLAQLAQALPQLAILVCTASASLSERVHGLSLGADDWLSTSCHPEELIARIERATTSRRPRLPPRESEPLTTGELHIRFDHQQVFVNGLSAQLTPREFEILTLLAATPGIVLPRGEIYSRLWGYTLAPGDRSVDVFIGKLRAKLKRISPGWEYLHTHFGVGYRFAAQLASESEDRAAAGDGTLFTSTRR